MPTKLQPAIEFAMVGQQDTLSVDADQPGGPCEMAAEVAAQEAISHLKESQEQLARSAIRSPRRVVLKLLSHHRLQIPEKTSLPAPTNKSLIKLHCTRFPRTMKTGRIALVLLSAVWHRTGSLSSAAGDQEHGHQAVPSQIRGEHDVRWLICHQTGRTRAACRCR